jgi:gallate decarboxylase subunit D
MALKTSTFITASGGRGPCRVVAEARRIGDDILVSVWGGTKPHIGSVAAALPRRSLRDPKRMSATSSVLNFTGHKDDMVSKLFSERIAARLGSNCIATAGIHIDNASGKTIALILRNCETACARMLRRLEKQR